MSLCGAEWSTSYSGFYGQGSVADGEFDPVAAVAPHVQDNRTFNEWQKEEAGILEQGLISRGVDQRGEVVDYTTLDLRIEPPSVTINSPMSFSDYRTEIEVCSANRIGTLFQMVQVITELKLSVEEAHISTDGKWVHDQIVVSDPSSKEQGLSAWKLNKLKLMLDPRSMVPPTGQFINKQADVLSHAHICTTVIDILCDDRVGLFVDTLATLCKHGVTLQSAEVWTYGGLGAIVLTATQDVDGMPQVLSPSQQAMLRKELSIAVVNGRVLDSGQEPVITMDNVKGFTHQERRLHSLLHKKDQTELQQRRENGSGLPDKMENMCTWDSDKQLITLQGELNSRAFTTANDDTPTDIRIVAKKINRQFNSFILLLVSCPNRNKLWFDCLYTLGEYYDIHHAEVSHKRGANNKIYARQRYYLKPQEGQIVWDQKTAIELVHSLYASISRRTPSGLRITSNGAKPMTEISEYLDAVRTNNFGVTRARITSRANAVSGTPTNGQQPKEGMSNSLPCNGEAQFTFEYDTMFLVVQEDGTTAITGEDNQLLENDNKRGNSNADVQPSQTYGKQTQRSTTAPNGTNPPNNGSSGKESQQQSNGYNNNKASTGNSQARVHSLWSGRPRGQVLAPVTHSMAGGMESINEQRVEVSGLVM